MCLDRTLFPADEVGAAQAIVVPRLPFGVVITTKRSSVSVDIADPELPLLFVPLGKSVEKEVGVSGRVVAAFGGAAVLGPSRGSRLFTIHWNIQYLRRGHPWWYPRGSFFLSLRHHHKMKPNLAREV